MLIPYTNQPNTHARMHAHSPHPVSQPLMRNTELKELIRMYSESAEHGEKKNIGAPKKN